MLEKTAVASLEQVKSRFPSLDALVKAKAVIECYQDIPCNPCEKNCPFGAIEIGDDINKQPRLLVDKCTGCGICVGICPGLAILLAQLKDDFAQFKIPYELLPLPKKGETWYAINRNGDVLGDCLIEHVMMSPKSDKTYLVTVKTSKEWLYEFVTIRSKDHE